jgi:hypothetical protein
MPITINGTGTITGISAGGLPDSCITSDDIATDAITSVKLVDGAVTSAKLAFGAGGKVLQVVRSRTASVITCSTTIPWDDSIPQSTEGTEVLTASITPISSTSTLHIKFDASGSASGAVTNSATVAIFKDSDVGAIYATQNPFWNASNWGCKFVASYYESSGTVLSRTYKVRVGADSPTIYINANGAGVRRYGGVSYAMLEVWEIGQ